ncbi:MAG: MaoC family dehydratase [Deltaproteobacteria bacterium]|nr:MAG: MaoC family dehydratase [Deltaproteobacteria bacterium]
MPPDPRRRPLPRAAPLASLASFGCSGPAEGGTAARKHSGRLSSMAEINRSLIGKWGPEGKMRVEFGKIREFARAVKEDNPLYFDEALCLAPPTFLMTMALWIGGLGESRSAVKLDLPRVLHGEQEFEYVKPIHGGDVLTFRSRTKEVFEKEGKRGGNMLFVVGETEFRNQHGEVVAYSRSTVIETAAPLQE